ncbi:MAG TPA: SDR family oxidoreductase, partial [Acidimicrobiales bacterium]|nr:SDR family oxidoreductase [Acidimicrobiales bacterium]
DIAADTGGGVVGHVLAVADRPQVDEVLARVADQLGPVDILVNNAAVNVQGQIWDYDPADWDRGIAVNLSACWYLCRRTMPSMRERGGGAIVNISSVAPYIGGAGVEAPYAVSKGGLHSLTRAVAVEGGPHNIRANTVTMGVVSGTRFIDAHPETADRYVGETPLGRNAVTADIVNAVMFLCSDQSSFITGEILNVAGGWHMRA